MSLPLPYTRVPTPFKMTKLNVPKDSVGLEETMIAWTHLAYGEVQFSREQDAWFVRKAGGRVLVPGDDDWLNVPTGDGWRNLGRYAHDPLLFTTLVADAAKRALWSREWGFDTVIIDEGPALQKPTTVVTCNERGFCRGEVEGVLEDVNSMLVRAYVDALEMQAQFGPGWGEDDSLL